MLNENGARIIMVLYDYKDWITSDRLSNRLSMNRRALRYELSNLKDEYPDDVKINSNNKLGYKLDFISEMLKKQVIGFLTMNQIDYQTPKRTSMIALYLLFSQGSVSITELSRNLFLSPTSIHNESITLKRWLNRIVGITLTIDREGMHIDGNEYSRRVACSTLGNSELLKHVMDIKEIEVGTRIKEIETQLSKGLISEGMMISGQEFNLFVRFVYVSYIRRLMGFTSAEHFTLSEQIDTELAMRLVGELDLGFGKQDIDYVAEYLIEHTTLEIQGNSIEEIRFKISSFNHYLSELFKVNFEIINSQTSLEIHLVNMIKRIKNNRKQVNYLDKKIMQTMPLEAFLAEYFCRNILEVDAPKAEILFLAPYLRNGMDALRKHLKIVLISNQIKSVAHSLSDELKKIIGQPCQIDYFPQYMYSNINLKDYDLYITTEAEIMFLNNSFILVPPISSSVNASEIKYRMSVAIAELMLEKNSVRDKFSKKIAIPDIGEYFAEIEKQHNEHSFLVEYFIDKKTLVHIRSSKELINGITIYKAKKAKKYLQHEIDQVISVTTNFKNLQETFALFDIVSEHLMSIKIE